LKRTKFEIYINILTAIQEGVTIPPRIMYNTNISSKPLLHILNELQSQNLIMETNNSSELEPQLLKKEINKSIKNLKNHWKKIQFINDDFMQDTKKYIKYIENEIISLKNFNGYQNLPFIPNIINKKGIKRYKLTERGTQVLTYFNLAHKLSNQKISLKDEPYIKIIKKKINSQ